MEQDKITPLSYENDSLGATSNNAIQLNDSPTEKGMASHHEHVPSEMLPRGEHRSDTLDSDMSVKRRNTSHTVRRHRRWLGLHPTAPIVAEHDVGEHAELPWSRVRVALKEPLAEFFGVMIMILFGCGSVAQVTLSQGQDSIPGVGANGNYQSISWCWGIGVMMGIYVAGDSGAYLNPAILLTSCILRKLPFRRFPVYFVAQLLGGFVGAGIVYANYINAIDAFEGYGNRTVPGYSTTATAGIFCTYPQAVLTKASQFFSEFIASAILMFVIFALNDDSNKGAFSASSDLFPLALFFLIFGLGAAFGFDTGYAMNIARDFGPRLMSYFVGYGHEVWSAGGYYFWIPMVAPFLGTLFGGILYDLSIYTGPTPVNTPWFGLKKLLSPRETIQDRIEAQKKAGIV